MTDVIFKIQKCQHLKMLKNLYCDKIVNWPHSGAVSRTVASDSSCSSCGFPPRSPVSPTVERHVYIQ